MASALAVTVAEKLEGAAGAAAGLRRGDPRRARLRVRSREGRAARARRSARAGCSPAASRGPTGRREVAVRLYAVVEPSNEVPQSDAAPGGRVDVGRRARAAHEARSTTTCSACCRRPTGRPTPTRWRRSSGARPRISTRSRSTGARSIYYFGLGVPRDLAKAATLLQEGEPHRSEDGRGAPHARRRLPRAGRQGARAGRSTPTRSI